jgi:hypothetical protein
MNILITNMKEETSGDGCAHKRELHLRDDGSVVDAHGKNIGIYGKNAEQKKSATSRRHLFPQKCRTVKCALGSYRW